MLKVVERRRAVPEHMSLYPTMDSVVDAITYIESQVPVVTANRMFNLLMIYHNTLIKQLNEQKSA